MNLHVVQIIFICLVLLAPAKPDAVMISGSGNPPIEEERMLGIPYNLNPENVKKGPIELKHNPPIAPKEVKERETKISPSLSKMFEAIRKKMRQEQVLNDAPSTVDVITKVEERVTKITPLLDEKHPGMPDHDNAVRLGFELPNEPGD